MLRALSPWGRTSRFFFRGAPRGAGGPPEGGEGARSAPRGGRGARSAPPGGAQRPPRKGGKEKKRKEENWRGGRDFFSPFFIRLFATSSRYALVDALARYSPQSARLADCRSRASDNHSELTLIICCVAVSQLPACGLSCAGCLSSWRRASRVVWSWCVCVTVSAYLLQRFSSAFYKVFALEIKSTHFAAALYGVTPLMTFIFHRNSYSSRGARERARHFSSPVL